MHEAWGIPFDWPWPLFVVALLFAGLIWLFSRPLGLVLLCWVVYDGIVWEVWAPLGWLFWIIFIVALIVALVYAITNLFGSGWFGPFARFLSFLLAGVLVLIIIIDFIYSLDDKEVNFNEPDAKGSIGNAQPSDAPSSSKPTATPSATNTQAPSIGCRSIGVVPAGVTIPSSTRPTWEGTYTKPNGESVTGPICAWPMSTDEPDNLGFTIPSLEEPDTSAELGRFLKHNWYGPTLFWAPPLAELDSFVTGDEISVSQLSSGGWSTEQAQLVGVEVSDILSDSTYSTDGSSISVILPNGETFTVLAATGELQLH